MAGFRYCSWCNGRGCMCCDAEQKKFNEKVLANAPRWREPDVRDLRDAVVEAELLRAYTPGLAVNEHGKIDALTPDEVETVFKPLLDAEYARQFPNGPQPIFTAKRTDGDDIALIRQAFRGITKENAVERFEHAGLIQAARQVLMPNDQDKSE